ncbi:unnamed protein product [Citrullus colocynthis]|uniref:Uncharacterized protein n=1 Tax=Citrullus colocynthis TaxID=252529 RepID=A0ABP0YFF0_9ROSI
MKRQDENVQMTSEITRVCNNLAKGTDLTDQKLFSPLWKNDPWPERRRNLQTFNHQLQPTSKKANPVREMLISP